MKYIDLHTHTYYSDGTDDVKSVVRASKLKGNEVLAITDHDVLEGYNEAEREGRKWGIEVIPGVEVTTSRYHILGLNVDPNEPKFNQLLGEILGLQRNRCEARVEILQDYGVPITMEKVDKAFPDYRLGTYNLFMAMVQDKECREYFEDRHPGMSPDDLFNFYLRGKGVAARIKGRFGKKSREVIERIHGAGGIAVIAHPFKDIDDISEMDKLVEKGLDGVEIQPNYGDANIPFREYAEKKGLFVTYGSDYHGPVVARKLLGRGENKMDNLDEILNRHGGSTIVKDKENREIYEALKPVWHDPEYIGLINNEHYFRSKDGWPTRRDFQGNEI